MSIGREKLFVDRIIKILQFSIDIQLIEYVLLKTSGF
jgi:hypothetical protein